MSAGGRTRIDPYAGFHPIFILPLPTVAQRVWRFVTAPCKPYSDADKGTQVPHIGQRWTQK
jgi:hypothetical protein